MKYNLIKIREGKVEDLSNVFNLIKELAKYENALNRVKINVKTLTEDGYGKNPQFKIFVAEYNSKIIGMGLVYFRYSTWKGKRLYLEDLIVNKKYRRQEIGKKLLKKIINYGKKNSCSGLMLQVLDWNEIGINFYKKYNFQFDNQWLNCYLDFNK